MLFVLVFAGRDESEQTVKVAGTIAMLGAVHNGSNNWIERFIRRNYRCTMKIEEKLELYRKALVEIGYWTQEAQDVAKEMNSEGALWRGCVAQANMALEEGGDAVEGRFRVYPEGYFDVKEAEHE